MSDETNIPEEIDQDKFSDAMSDIEDETTMDNNANTEHVATKQKPAEEIIDEERRVPSAISDDDDDDKVRKTSANDRMKNVTNLSVDDGEISNIEPHTTKTSTSKDNVTSNVPTNNASTNIIDTVNDSDNLIIDNVDANSTLFDDDKLDDISSFQKNLNDSKVVKRTSTILSNLENKEKRLADEERLENMQTIDDNMSYILPVKQNVHTDRENTEIVPDASENSQELLQDENYEEQIVPDDENIKTSKIDEEIPVHEVIDEETPDNEQMDGNASVNEIIDEEVPPNEVFDEEAPANEVADEEIPTNNVIDEETPANEVGDEEMPNNQTNNTELPVNETIDEEIPPTNETIDEGPPADEVADEQIPVNNMFDDEPSVNELPNEEIPNTASNNNTDDLLDDAENISHTGAENQENVVHNENADASIVNDKDMEEPDLSTNDDKPTEKEEDVNHDFDTNNTLPDDQEAPPDAEQIDEQATEMTSDNVNKEQSMIRGETPDNMFSNETAPFDENNENPLADNETVSNILVADNTIEDTIPDEVLNDEQNDKQSAIDNQPADNSFVNDEEANNPVPADDDEDSPLDNNEFEKSTTNNPAIDDILAQASQAAAVVPDTKSLDFGNQSIDDFVPVDSTNDLDNEKDLEIISDNEELLDDAPAAAEKDDIISNNNNNNMELDEDFEDKDISMDDDEKETNIKPTDENDEQMIDTENIENIDDDNQAAPVPANLSTDENDENMFDDEDIEEILIDDKKTTTAPTNVKEVKTATPIDELEDSIMTSPVPNKSATDSKLLVNLSIDEDKLSNMYPNDLTLRDVVLGDDAADSLADGRSARQIMSSRRKPTITSIDEEQPTDETSSTKTKDPLINDKKTENIESDEDDDNASWAFPKNKIPAIPLKPHRLAPLAGGVPVGLPPVKIGAPGKLSAIQGKVEELLTEDEDDKILDFSRPGSAAKKSIINGNNIPGKSSSDLARPSSALKNTRALSLSQSEERQRTNLSSASKTQAPTMTRRNTEHTIVDLSKLADVSHDNGKSQDIKSDPEDLTNSTMNDDSVNFFTHDKDMEKNTASDENVDKTTASTQKAVPLLTVNGASIDSLDNMENSENMMNDGAKSEDMMDDYIGEEESTSFLDKTNLSRSDDGRIGGKSDSGSSSKVMFENETIGNLSFSGRKSVITIPGRKTNRLSYIESAHVIQLHSSKESHMRALPSEKFWRRNQRRVSSMPTAEEGQAAKE